MKKLGLIINPIAGMGGRVGLKGTDGEGALRRARALGARPEAHRRAVEALKVVAAGMPNVALLTCGGAMGEDAALECGMKPALVEAGREDGDATTADDTRKAAPEMRREGVDLLLFAGGDGTARDICDALGGSDGAGAAGTMATLGIPAGVKMHSGVFALTPHRAGETALRFLRGELAATADVEVMDIDEKAFRAGRLSARLYGYLNAPQDSAAVQFTKSGTTGQDGDAAAEIARQVIADMADDTLYIIGSGTTTAAISDALGMANTLLGVDVALNGELLAADASETELLNLTEGKPAKIVVSAIGGQGYIFGRGNQQVSARVIRRVGKDNIIVVATREKLLELRGRPLLVDTGDAALDAELSGYVRVVTGFGEAHIYEVSC